jgi:hypothetical protein
MVANGDAAKPIWISEMNANAVPNDPAVVDVGRFGQVTPEQQARFAPLAYERAMEEWPWVGVVNFWFFKRATDLERNQAMYYFRMVEPDFAPLPVYEAMREYTAGVVPTLYPGYHQEDHWALVYEGAWETTSDPSAVLGAYRRAVAPGAALSLVYEGASLTLVPAPGTAEIDVRVNGSSSRRITLAGQSVRLAGGTMGARREVTLTVVSGEAGVDGIIVARPWRPSGALWLVLGLLLAGSWVVARRSWRRR